MIRLLQNCKKSKDAVRYRIKKLEEEKIIRGYRTWIDYSKIGYRTSTIYLNLINLPEKRKKLIEDLKKDKRVYWLVLQREFGILELLISSSQIISL